MFWIALSVLIMNLTGEGDDSYVLRKFIERAREAVGEHVHDAARRRAALGTLDRTQAAFNRHRRRVGKISACIERADRTHAVTRAEYQRCLRDVQPAWDAAAAELIALERDFRASLTPGELAAVRRAAERR
jgi:hypothetical protein